MPSIDSSLVNHVNDFQPAMTSNTAQSATDISGASSPTLTSTANPFSSSPGSATSTSSMDAKARGPNLDTPGWINSNNPAPPNGPHLGLAILQQGYSQSSQQGTDQSSGNQALPPQSRPMSSEAGNGSCQSTGTQKPAYSKPSMSAADMDPGYFPAARPDPVDSSLPDRSTSDSRYPPRYPMERPSPMTMDSSFPTTKPSITDTYKPSLREPVRNPG